MTYSPACRFCNDEGCSICDGQQAAMLARRVNEQKTDELAEEAKRFILKYLKRDRYNRILAPATNDEMLEFTMRAIDWGRQRCEEKRGYAGSRA